MRRVLLQSAIQNPKSRIQNHVSALRRSELGHGHGQAIAARMHGSAPWKTEETIVGLPRLLVLSAFSRFGGCHLSAPPFPFFEQLCKTEDKSPKSLSHKGVELRRMMYANPILPQRSHRRPVVLDRTTLARLSGRTASQDRSARRRRCHLLHPPGRLPVALPPQGFPPQEHRLEILRPVATQRHARNDPRPAPPQGPRGAEALLAPDLGERRQPVGRHHLGRRAAGPGQRQGRRWQETPYRRGQHGC